ncbi:MAG: hypothetical protein QXJ75_05325 [Candidatus Bathyarchaeia archaeon]
MTTYKVTVMFICILIVTAITSFTGGHWNDTDSVSGTVKIGHRATIIDSWKVITPVGYPPYDETTQLTPDRRTLQITATEIFNVTETELWYIWVGLLVKNDGTLPVNIIRPLIKFIPGGNDFTVEETRFYGPYDKAGFKVVWGKVKVNDLNKPPFTTDWKNPPIAADPTQHVVIWIKISYKGTEPLDTAQINITIRDELAI